MLCLKLIRKGQWTNAFKIKKNNQKVFRKIKAVKVFKINYINYVGSKTKPESMNWTKMSLNPNIFRKIEAVKVDRITKSIS